MSRLLLVSLGQLNGHILEAVARSGAFAEILVAGRDSARGARKTNQARIGAAIEGRYPAISFIELDVNNASAAAILRETAPDVALAAPSMLPWWQIDRLAGAKGEAARAVPFAGWIACHLAPMLAVRRAWADSGLDVPWVGASYPDVVNTILHRSGPGPVCGVGNVDEMIPKIRFAAAGETGCDPAAVEVRLVAQHALEYFVYREIETPASEAPPFMLRAKLDGRDISDAAARAILRPLPIPYALDFNLLTASSALGLLPALAGQEPVNMHVPAPNGLPGGYPVRVEAGRVSLDLPAEWAMEDAVASNVASLPWDGLRSIEADGTPIFTEATSRALFDFTGKHYQSLAPDRAAAMAAELVAAAEG
jgi:hypothetical protein